MAWTTPDKALVWTGEDVTPEELERASGVIELYAGRLQEEPAEAITVVDRRWLAQATAYQAVWMRGKPGLMTQRESHTSSSADGVAVTRESDSQIMLAPLASRCLRNLSWVGTRSTTQLPVVPLKGSILSERADPFHAWKPLDI